MLTADDVLSAAADFDVFDAYWPGDPCADAVGPDRLRAIYRVKCRVAAAVGPRAVLEVGVRAGYSAAAFLAACPHARYVGLDKDDGSHGGAAGALEHARAVLWRRYPAAWVEVYPWDSGDPRAARRLLAWWRSAFDLAHIDGDHTEEGCARDLRLAAALVRPGGYLLVDDYDLLAEVRLAADRFVRETGYRAAYVPSPHGDLLIERGQP